MVREHEEEERPFDPEKRGTWRGSSRELVVNPKLVVNPDDFYRDLEELIIKRWGRTFSDPEEKLAEAKRILKEGGKPRDVMQDLDELLDTHGVESVLGIPDEVSYLNAGDTYEPTIMYSHDDNKYFVSDWGTLVEEAQPKAEEDAWDNWLEADVRGAVREEFEARFPDDERSLERAEEALDAIESAELRGKFWHAMNDAGGEYEHSHDGSIDSVINLAGTVQELAGTIIEEMNAVPEQTSFGFNPQSPERRRFLAARKRERGGHEPKFSVGDRVRDKDGARTGTVAVVGEYDAHLGGYRYKVQADDGPRHYWNETSMESVARAPRVRSNPRSVHNPNCDGSHCVSETGEVRVLPYGGGGNLILCHACHRHEIDFRRDRNRELGRRAFELPSWESLEVYGSDWQSNARRGKPREFAPGTKVRMSGKFLRSTGNYTGQDAHSTWKVVEDRGDMVLVDEPADLRYFTQDELRTDPSLKWRRIAKGNLIIAGRPDYT